MNQRITIDPVTRIEEHLCIDYEIENGVVSKTWASGTAWHGMEKIVKNRDLRDAWIIVQRIYGVCTIIHVLSSVRAAESALNIDVPVNVQYARNIILTAYTAYGHIARFHQPSALNWADITSTLQADLTKTSEMLKGVSIWHLNSPEEFTKVQSEIKDLVASGQLGIFTNGYWGHPAMKLPPEVNLIAVAYYLQVLECQRDASHVVALLDGKTPYTQNLAVDDVASPIDFDGLDALNPGRLMYIEPLIGEPSDFIEQAYRVDAAVIAAFYPEWLARDEGTMNYLSVPEFSTNSKDGSFLFPDGYTESADSSSYRPITSHFDGYLIKGIQESAKHSWYKDEAPQAPWEGITISAHGGWPSDGKYSWVRSPISYGETVEVGPLANMLVKLAAGRKSTQDRLNEIVAIYQKLTDSTLEVAQLRSTLGHIIGRTIHCCELRNILQNQYNALIVSIGKNDHTTFMKPNTLAAGELRDVDFLEVPRGTPSHWMMIRDGIISDYQTIIPSAWNSGPRSFNGNIGPYEQSLVGIPVADPNKPLEVVRTIHSFDPCMVCAAHIMDADGNKVVSVRVL